MRFYPFILLAFCVATASAQPINSSGGALHPEQAAFDVRHYDLDLRIDPATETIDGTLTMRADIVVPTPYIRLDLDGPLTVKAVRVQIQDGESMERVFERDSLTIRIPLGRTAQPGETIRVAVEYGGAPRVAPNPPWVGGFSWSETEAGEPWVAVSCQGEGADIWWPTKDHPSDEPDSMSIALTVPDGLKGIANGRFDGTTPAQDGWSTWHWTVTTSINNYGVSFGVAPFVEVDQDYESPLGYSMPVTFYALPENEADARRMLPQFLDHIRFLEETLGPYPFRRDGYKILHTPYLGMEHQSLIAYGSTFSDNDFGFDWLHFHELAHEWFANLVTAPDWGDMWVHEGFAEFLEALYAEQLAERAGQDGEAAFHAYLDNMASRIVNRRPVALSRPRDTHRVYFGADARGDGDIYFKGAWVLKTLRFYLGDAAFFEGLKRVTYPDGIGVVGRDQDCACHFTSTEDVQRAFEAASGQDLDAFFRVYLHQPALPVLDLHTTGSTMDLRWIIPDGVLDEGQAFDVPIPVRAGETSVIRMPEGSGSIPLPRPRTEVDPSRWLLMERSPDQ